MLSKDFLKLVNLNKLIRLWGLRATSASRDSHFRCGRDFMDVLEELLSVDVDWRVVPIGNVLSALLPSLLTVWVRAAYTGQCIVVWLIGE